MKLARIVNLNFPFSPAYANWGFPGWSTALTACETFTPTSLTLVYSGTSVGDMIQALTPEMTRKEEISKHHNYWSDVVVLDGRYPALVYAHSFLVYKLETSRFAFADFYYGLSAKMKLHAPQTLELKAGGATVLWFGNCYLDNVKLEDPQYLFLHQAGIVNLNFVGTVVPSLVSLG